MYFLPVGTSAFDIYRIKTGSRLFKVPRYPKIYIFNARMKRYLEVSVQITELFLSFEVIFNRSCEEKLIIEAEEFSSFCRKLNTERNLC